MNSYFYMNFAALTRNEWVISITEQLLMYFFGCSQPVYNFYSMAVQETKADHARIIRALLARAADSVRAAPKPSIV